MCHLSRHYLPVRVRILNLSSSLLATKVHFLVPYSLTNSTIASSSLFDHNLREVYFFLLRLTRSLGLWAESSSSSSSSSPSSSLPSSSLPSSISSFSSSSRSSRSSSDSGAGLFSAVFDLTPRMGTLLFGWADFFSSSWLGYTCASDMSFDFYYYS